MCVHTNKHVMTGIRMMENGRTRGLPSSRITAFVIFYSIFKFKGFHNIGHILTAKLMVNFRYCKPNHHNYKPRKILNVKVKIVFQCGSHNHNQNLNPIVLLEKSYTFS